MKTAGHKGGLVMSKRILFLFLVVLTVALISAGQALAAAPPTNGLAAWYPFNGDANDYSGNGKNGTLYGPVPVPDRAGTPNYAYGFYGSPSPARTDYIRIPHSGSLAFSTGFSVTFWVKFNQISRTDDNYDSQAIFTKNTFSSFGLMLCTNSSCAGTLRFYHTGLSLSSSDYSWKTVQANTWYHVAVTYGDGYTSQYINGELVTQTAVTGTLGTNTAALYIGKNNHASALYPLDGQMDDLRLYNRALTPQEVLDTYGRTIPSVSAGSGHTCGVKTDWSVACWGNNGDGQSTAPTGTFAQVSAGGYHTCGVKTDGSVACWGWNNYGQATAPTGTFAQVSAGFYHTCGVKTDGSVACWGYKAPAVNITPTTLPLGAQDTSYSQTLTASGGTGPYTFKITTGVLPPGLSLSSDGIISGTPTAPGTYSFSIEAVDSSAIPFSGTMDYTLTIKPKSTTNLALTAGANPSTYGQSLTFTATVTSGATGTVTFTDGSTSMCSNVVLDAGYEASCSTTSLTGGLHTITATYSGDGNYNGSSGSYNQTVKYLLTVNRAGTGAGTAASNPAGINCGTDCQEAYTENTIVTLTPTASTGSTLSTWTGCDTVAGNQCQVTMTANKSVTAKFNKVWSSNPTVNNAISTAVKDQINPQIASDGSGGAIVTWQDYRSGSNWNIYAQRIDSTGNYLWTANGVLITGAANDQTNPQIVGDGSGGAIVTWQDKRSGTNLNIYAQKIDSGGIIKWGTNGKAITVAANDQTNPQIVSDGSGGAIITWQDYRSGTNLDIYAQKIDSGGIIKWGTNGKAITIAANDQTNPQIVSDDSGGAIIAWDDYRSGTNWDIRTQRIDSNGLVQWLTNGVGITGAGNDQRNTQMVSDGNGGAIITWQDKRTGTNTDIYARRIDATGAVMWTSGGVAIAIAANDQINPRIVSDGFGGAIITWDDYRSGTNHDIYIQKVESDGKLPTAP